MHERSCNNNPNKIPYNHPGWKNYDEVCKKLSNTMKEKHKKGLAPTLS